MKRSRNKAFTLAELLIALAILGVIATFTIPKILQGQQDSKRKAIVREAYASVNQIIYMGRIQGQINSSNSVQYVLDHLNAVKICRTNMDTEGCRSVPMANGWSTGQAGAVLHNGASVAIMSSFPWELAITIDWNGDTAPNASGAASDDEVSLVGNISNTPQTFTDGSGHNTIIQPGMIGYNQDLSLTYFDIFNQ